MKYICIFTMSFMALEATAQTVPAGYCGVEYSYDAAGNRIKRKYVCVAAPGVMAAKLSEEKSESIISGMYPNPNDGKFSVNFSKDLPPSQMKILDVNGKLIIQKKISGLKTEVDISHLPDGIYFVSVDFYGKVVTERIVKMR